MEVYLAQTVKVIEIIIRSTCSRCFFTVYINIHLFNGGRGRNVYHMSFTIIFHTLNLSIPHIIL